MELEEVVRRRRMVRRFAAKAVPADSLERVLSMAVRAPSAGFTQGWEFLVLEGPDQTDRFWAAAWPSRSTPPDPPVVVVPLADREAYLARYAEPDKAASPGGPERWPVDYWEVDTAFATMLMLLAAVDEGLGAWFFGIDADGVRHAFGVPDSLQPIGAVAIGYPADEPRAAPHRRRPRERRPLDDVIHRGRWQGGPR